MPVWMLCFRSSVRPFDGFGIICSTTVRAVHQVPRVRLEIVAAVRNWLGVETVTYSNAFVRVDQDRMQ